MTSPNDLEKLREEIARVLVEAEGEDPDAFHEKAAYESGYCLPDHAIPLWRQKPYFATAKAILAIPAIAERLRLVPVGPMVVRGSEPA